MFPTDELNLILTLTNVDLRRYILPSTTTSDIIKLFGVLILITCYDFLSLHYMWSSRYQYKSNNPTSMGNSGSKIPRCDHLCSCIQFSRQHNPRPEWMSMKEWGCQLIN